MARMRYSLETADPVFKMAARWKPVAAQLAEGIRSVYPFSVVRGGVYSEAEVAKALETDPIVAAHYSDVNIQRLHAIRLARARLGYVSYRVGDKIFWSRKQTELDPGEVVLTDGRLKIRARGGNLISDKPRSPVRVDEPAEVTSNVPTADLMVVAANEVDVVTGSAQETASLSLPAEETDMSWWPASGGGISAEAAFPAKDYTLPGTPDPQSKRGSARCGACPDRAGR